MRVNIDNLHYSANGKAILSHIALAIESGAKVGILGPNGSGKTTLLKLLAGLLKPHQGQIRFADTPINKFSAKQMATQVGLMGQHAIAECQLLGKEIVLLGQLFGSDLERFKQITEQTQVVDLLDSPFNQLSGGEQQRIMLAQLLYQTPKLLLLDEPSNHLDIKHIWGLMAQVMRSPQTVLATFHCFNTAAEFCDQLILIQDGQILIHDTVDQVLTPQWLKQVFAIDADIHTKKNGRLSVLVNHA